MTDFCQLTCIHSDHAICPTGAIPAHHPPKLVLLVLVSWLGVPGVHVHVAQLQQRVVVTLKQELASGHIGEQGGAGGQETAQTKLLIKCPVSKCAKEGCPLTIHQSPLAASAAASMGTSSEVTGVSRGRDWPGRWCQVRLVW